MDIKMNKRVRYVLRFIRLIQNMICILSGALPGYYIPGKIADLDISVYVKLLIYLVFVVGGSVGLLISRKHLLKNSILYEEFSFDWANLKSSLLIISLIFCLSLLLVSLASILYYIVVFLIVKLY